MVFAPQLVRLIAPGYADVPDKFALTVTLTRIVFPYILLISLATMLMGQLNSLGHFAVPAAAPAALNIGIILMALWVGPRLERPALALAMGVILGGLAQLLMQLPPLIKRKALPRLIWAPGLKPVRTMGRRVVPVILGAAAYQINLLVNTLLASYLPEGSVSYLYYADRLVQFPLGVFAVAMGTAILPSLSRQAAQGDFEGLAASTSHGFRLSLFINLPSAVGLALLAQPLVELIYQRGAFDAWVSLHTIEALYAYALGLPAAALVTVVVRFFNALGDTKTPAYVGGISVAANIVLSLVLMGPLAHSGLALASSLAVAINLVLLLAVALRRHGFLRLSGLFGGGAPDDSRLGGAGGLPLALFLVAGFAPFGQPGLAPGGLGGGGRNRVLLCPGPAVQDPGAGPASAGLWKKIGRLKEDRMLIEDTERYFEGLVPARDGLLLELEQEAEREGIPIVGPVVGRLLHLLTGLMGARLVLEMGTASGYSALHLASAMGPEGRLICLESDPEMVRRARRNLERAGLFQQVEVVPGPALETAAGLSGPFDLVFLDFNKEEYLPALDQAHRLLRIGGLVVADNTTYAGTADFTAALRDRPEWLDVHLLSFLPGHRQEHDGLSLARKIY